jgi:hypothetical protein
MTYTYAYLDLPDLPQSIIDAAWAVAEKNKHTKAGEMNNWLTRPGYAEYEYRNFTLKTGKAVKTLRSHRFGINEEFNQWVQNYFKCDPSTCGVAVYDSHSNFFAPHVDISRDYVMSYILDQGGNNVETIWYQQDNHPIVRPDLKSVFDPAVIPKNFDTLKEIDRVRLPKHKWVSLNASILHGVENIESTRVAIHISTNDPLSHINLLSASLINEH